MHNIAVVKRVRVAELAVVQQAQADSVAWVLKVLRLTIGDVEI